MLFAESWLKKSVYSFAKDLAVCLTTLCLIFICQVMPAYAGKSDCVYAPHLPANHFPAAKGHHISTPQLPGAATLVSNGKEDSHSETPVYYRGGYHGDKSFVINRKNLPSFVLALLIFSLIIFPIVFYSKNIWGKSSE